MRACVWRRIIHQGSSHHEVSAVIGNAAVAGAVLPYLSSMSCVTRVISRLCVCARGRARLDMLMGRTSWRVSALTFLFALRLTPSLPCVGCHMRAARLELGQSPPGPVWLAGD